MISKNCLLEEIAVKLAWIKPDWNAIVDRFTSTFPGNTGNYEDHDLKSLFAEIHLRTSLERICKAYGTRVIFDPIPKGSETKDFYFCESPRNENLEVLRKVAHETAGKTGFRKGEIYSELDLLLKVDDLPVLFEVKTSKSRSKGSGARAPSTKGIRYAVEPERADYVIKPIQQFFNTEKCGFVLVVPDDSFSNSGSQWVFVKNNGIIIPLYTTREQFSEDVKAVKEKYNL